MAREITLVVEGERVRRSGGTAGVTGEGNVTALLVQFDETWEAMAKKVTFFDALGKNPVVRTLTTDLMVDLTAAIKVYRVMVPPEPLKTEGDCTLVLDGYRDGVRARSVSIPLTVHYAPTAQGTAPDPTPSQAEQLQKQIDGLMGGMTDQALAAKVARVGAEDARDGAVGAKDLAATAAGSATAAAERSEAARDEAVTARSEAVAAKAGAKNALAGTLHARDAALAAKSDAERARGGASLAKEGADLALVGAERAKASAESAKAAAVVEAANAKREAQDARTARDGVEGYAAQAKKSAKDAAASATDAAASAAATAVSQVAAGGSADRAATAEVAAGLSQVAAKESEQASAFSASSAESAKVAAGLSQVSANESQRAAADSATSAATDAAVATAKAGEASKRATAAKASETAAAGSAAASETQADRAKSEADRAAEIVGGDFATTTEVRGYLSDHDGNAGAHGTLFAGAAVRLEMHAADGVKHITAEERTAWNGKETAGSAAAVQTSLTAHTNNKSNPHGVTAGQIGAVPASSIGYGTCSTASTTTAKVCALSGFALAVGAIVGIRFINGNTAAAATLNVNGTGAKPIYYCDAYVTSSMITAGMTAIFQYNGAQWVLLNPAVNGSSLFIIDITFDASFSGKAFTVNTNGFSYSGTVPGSLTAAVVASVPSALYTIACEGKTATVSTTNYFGVYPVTIIYIPYFANATWTEVAAAVAADNVPAYWKIGDTKDITLTGGEVLTIAIYGKKHDDLTSGGKAGITFGLKNLMAANRQMNTSDTSEGGFTGSAMYSWLQNDLYNSLPADLKTVIKSVNKKTSAGNWSTTINTNAMKIFLFSEVECRGLTAFAAAGEGAQYPIFTDNTSRIKYQANGTGAADSWWVRSPYAATTDFFCSILASGGVDFGYASSDSYGVCFGFCI